MKVKRLLAAILGFLVAIGMITNATVALADGGKPTHIITIHYVLDDADKSLAASPYVATVADGADFTADVPSPEVTGYTPDKASVHLDYKGVSADQSVEVVYHPKQVEFHVKHLIKDLDGKEVVYQEDVAKAAVGDEVFAAPIAIKGFVVAEVPAVTKVPANETLTLTVKYDRLSYQVSYDSAGGTPVASFRGYFGEAVPVPENPTREGYEFVGWQPAIPKTVPDADVTLTAQWKTKAEASYQVVYWLEFTNVNHPMDGWGNYGQLWGQTTAVGKPGAPVVVPTTIPVKGDGYPVFDLPGYIGAGSIDKYVYIDTEKTAKANKDLTIAADGSTVVNVYVARARIDLVVMAPKDYGNYPDENNYYMWRGKKHDKTNPIRLKLRFGDSFEHRIPTSPSDYPGLEKNTKYSFVFYTLRYQNTDPQHLGWRNYDAQPYVVDFRLINQEYSYVDPVTNVEEPGVRWIIASVGREGSRKVVEKHFYFQDLVDDQKPEDFPEDASRYVLASEDISNNYGARTPLIEGFEPVSRLGKVTCLKYEEDNPNRCAHFRIEYRYKRLKPEVRRYLLPTDVVPEATKAFFFKADIGKEPFLKEEPQKPASVPDGYVFGGWVERDGYPAEEWSSMPHHDIDFYAKWVPAKKTLKVTFDPNNGDDLHSVTVPFGEKVVKPPAPPRFGYRFVGWREVTKTRALPPLYNFANPVRKDLALQAVWEPYGVSSVFVNHLKHTGSGTENSATVWDFVGVGTKFVAKAMEIPGYVPDALYKELTVSQNPLSNVITFNYTRATKTQFTIRYVERTSGGETELLPKEIVETTNTSETRTAKAIAGYSPLTGQLKILITANPDDNVMTFVYRKNSEAKYQTEVYVSDGKGGYNQLDKLTTLMSGPAGQTVTFTPSAVADHQLNSAKSVLSGTITSDGKLVLRAYFDLVDKPVKVKPGQPGKEKPNRLPGTGV